MNLNLTFNKLSTGKHDFRIPKHLFQFRTMPSFHSRLFRQWLVVWWPRIQECGIPATVSVFTTSGWEAGSGRHQSTWTWGRPGQLSRDILEVWHSGPVKIKTTKSLLSATNTAKNCVCLKHLVTEAPVTETMWTVSAPASSIVESK